MHGFALFETILAIDGKAKLIQEHRNRLEVSCRRLGWAVPDFDWEPTLHLLLQKNGLAHGSARVRLTMSAGAGSIHDVAQGSDSQTWITATSFEPRLESLKMSLSPWRRNEHSPLAGLKSASYAENILALNDARIRGFNEALFLNQAGEVCEAATSNIFLVRGGQLMTPHLASGCLPGTTRQVILQIGTHLGYRTEELALNIKDLNESDEIFLTSAIRGPVPVFQLDERKFGPTPTTDKIRAAWWKEICRR